MANAIDELSHVKFCVYDHHNVYSYLICNLILVQHYCMCAMIKYNSKQSWFLVYVLYMIVQVVKSDSSYALGRIHMLYIL